MNQIDRIAERFKVDGKTAIQSLAAAVGKNQATIYRWREYGWVTPQARKLILDAAELYGVVLTPEDWHAD